MSKRKKVIIVGSGAGGAAAAMELADTCDVTILEAGKDFHPFSGSLDHFALLRKTGLFLDERMIRIFIPNMQVRRSESMVMVNGVGIGGTTTLATGNAVRSDQGLRAVGIDLDSQFEKLDELLPITTEHQKYWNPATQELFNLFKEMGLDPRPTPKLLKNPHCANCGRCAIGCPYGFKWDTRDMLPDAMKKGVKLITDCRVQKLLIQDGEVTGLKAVRGFREVTFQADLYILAAGGFGTPVILENSGISCPETLFVDPVLCVAAVRKDFGQDSQLLMPFYSRQEGYMLSPYIDYLSFFFHKKWRYPKKDIISLMVKMSDDSLGSSEKHAIHKKVTADDRKRLLRGARKCREILARMGIPKEETFTGILNAGHPGGMLPLTTETKDTLHDSRLPANLYAADCTLFPHSEGLPPILTIMALAMKVAETAQENILH